MKLLVNALEHIALYRSWRSQTFQDLVGQQHLTRTLQNSLLENRISHAYLFSGPRGTGKTSAAKILAKAVNCLNGPSAEPCNECEVCISITEGSSIDVVEIDAASNNGVEEIRDIRDKVKYAPTKTRRKVYIIDEVHMLTTGAFNALLKTLEEPPSHVMFILATTEPHKLPVTIISRCQRFDFHRISLEDQAARLAFICEQEGLTPEQEALEYIARLSDGGMRDALSVLDQVIAYAGSRISLEHVLDVTGGISSEQFAKLAQFIAEQNIGGSLSVIQQLLQEGKSADKCIENLLYYFRDLLMIRLVPHAQSLTDRLLDESAVQSAGLQKLHHDQIFRIIDTLNHYQVEMKFSAQPKTMLELAVMKACLLLAEDKGTVEAPKSSSAQFGSASEWGLLLNKVKQMEEQLAELKQTADEHQPIEKAKAPSQRNPRPSQTKNNSNAASVKLTPYVTDKDEKALSHTLKQWGQILQRVKEQKITVHAWLIDGEPVSVHDGSLLVAFKNAMHRETTERDANRQ
ncbi:MAG: DNA polymerase III subunit gamma/tau, partial [Paenibacillus sp. RIFOXYA1_FULL_44_5]